MFSKKRKYKERKDKTLATLFSFFLGGFGVHKFYLGKVPQGILYCMFSWTIIPGILGVFNGFRLLTMSQEEFDIRYNYSFFPEMHDVDVEFEKMRRQYGKKKIKKPPFGIAENSVADEIQKLSLLMEKGYITFEEFEKSKAELLEKIK